MSHLTEIPQQIRDILNSPLRDGFGAVLNNDGTIIVEDGGVLNSQSNILSYYDVTVDVIFFMYDRDFIAFNLWFNETLRHGVSPFLYDFQLTPDIIFGEAQFIGGYSYQKFSDELYKITTKIAMKFK